jgi:hypothetical protein
MRVKTKQKDLHKAARTLKGVVTKHLKLRKHGSLLFENTVWRKRCFGRYYFKGDPLKLAERLKKQGFVMEQKTVAEVRVLRYTKIFTYGGQVFTARLAIMLDDKRLTLSVLVEPEAALL